MAIGFVDCKVIPVEESNYATFNLIFDHDII